MSSTRPGPTALWSGQRERALQRQLVGGPADRYPDLAAFHHPGPGSRVPAGERGPVGVQPEGDPARLARLERDPGEAGQPLVVLFIVMRKQVMRSLGSVVMR